ncbi:SGNH/GDSL hydrolase family protein [Microbacterium sp. ZW T5_56]|uniref:SGNH/GDSL hydrolase family protein n=1 Tax=Microbacterium sp. ZW T5_56 TaxID=3378081 RepID=UPI003851B775
MWNTDARRLRALLSAADPITWVLTGDSITHGLVHTQGARNYVDHLHELVRGDLGRSRDAMINTAISGWRTAQLLADFDHRVARWQPQIVTLMIGTNDCSSSGKVPLISADEYAASLEDFVTRVRRLDAIPVLLTPPPVDERHAPERARVPEFAHAMRTVARAHRVVLVDVFTRFQERGRDRIDGVPWQLLADPFHPNATGHALIARELATALGLARRDSETVTRLRGIVGARR